ncbi:MAG TPA: type 4a pilus biogenesis protein PilO [Candidatus Omnitrophota bacterium]|nr:type 4a pilus biogenesis protein PilO [Candidatus Omnitrophota bacterium]
MRIQRLNARERFFALIIGLLLFAWFLGNVVLTPVWKFFSEWSVKIQLNKGRLSQDRRLILEGPAIDREYEAYLPFFHQAQDADAIGSSREEAIMSLLLSQIESTAGRIPLTVLEIKPQKVRDEDFYNVFSINLTIEEEFIKVYRFLYDIQNAPLLFNVEELRLEKDPLKETFMKCTLILTKRLIRFQHK